MAELTALWVWTAKERGPSLGRPDAACVWGDLQPPAPPPLTQSALPCPRGSETQRANIVKL